MRKITSYIKRVLIQLEYRLENTLTRFMKKFASNINLKVLFSFSPVYILVAKLSICGEFHLFRRFLGQKKFLLSSRFSATQLPQGTVLTWSETACPRKLSLVAHLVHFC